MSSHRCLSSSPLAFRREGEWERKAPLIRARDVTLPLSEPSNDALEDLEEKSGKLNFAFAHLE